MRAKSAGLRRSWRCLVGLALGAMGLSACKVDDLVVLQSKPTSTSGPEADAGADERSDAPSEDVAVLVDAGDATPGTSGTRIPGCGWEGDTCARGTDCCSMYCVMNQSAGTCAVLSACTPADGKSCTRQIGEPCSSVDDCCSRRCEWVYGVQRCASAGGCFNTCQVCQADSECCSRQCLADGNGVRRCGPAPNCVSEGELCKTSSACCEGGPSLCASSQGIGPERCQSASGSVCRSNGSMCALTQQCCSGKCYPRAGDALLTCLPECVQEGDRCTFNTDCCYADALCVRRDGRLVCWTPPGGRSPQ